MTIYNKQRRTKVNYRKIYEQHHGLIPKELDGRKYEIHHVDGNSHNNNPENLIAITIQAHYDIHYSQGDFAACLRIAAKMKWSGEEISEIAKLNHKKRIEKGKHPWQKRKDGSSHTKDRISKPDYINPFTDKNKGKENSRFIPTLRQFENIKTGEVIETTQYDFASKYGYDRGAVSRLVRGIFPTYRGWRMLYSS